MPQHIATVTLVIDDYDAAVRFYVDTLGFTLNTDTPLGEGKRWVTVSPGGQVSTQLLLAKADGATQASRIGNQTGGRVFLFLETDDFGRDYTLYQARGVRFLEQPRRESYGTVAVFTDCFGNRWDLIQPAGAESDGSWGSEA